MHRQFEDKVAGFIAEYGLLSPGSRVLVGVSGGADSVALLHVLVALHERGMLDLELACAHVNHQLRGQQAMEDQAFVQQQSEKLGIRFFCKAVDVRSFAQDAGLSIETAGRILRLDALSQIALQAGCGWIALGHQADDNAETILHRLVRGCGFRGLAGIWPARSLPTGPRIIRPMLCVRRTEIYGYLQARGIKWREDPTNLDLCFTRNAIRHRLIPWLQSQCGGSLVDQLCSLALTAFRLYRDQIIPQALALACAVIESNPGMTCLSTDRLRGIGPLVRLEVLRQALVSAGCKEMDLTSGHYEGLEGLMSGRCGGVSLPGGVLAWREGARLCIGRPTGMGQADETPLLVELPVPGSVQIGGLSIEARLMEAEEFARPSHGRFEYMDWEMIRPPLLLRRPLPGDRFVPLGSSSPKKVARFLIDAKVPRSDRQAVIIVADQEKIIWVCPIRISQLVRPRPCTRRVLVLEVRTRTERGT